MTMAHVAPSGSRGQAIQNQNRTTMKNSLFSKTGEMKTVNESDKPEAQEICQLVIDLYEAQVAANDCWSDFSKSRKPVCALSVSTRPMM
jgi:hypothetical protein